MSYRSLAALAAASVFSTAAFAQAVGFATLPPGSLNHTTASAVAKVLSEKAGMNMLVQPTAGDNVIIPMVNRGESLMGLCYLLTLYGFVRALDSPVPHRWFAPKRK